MYKNIIFNESCFDTFKKLPDNSIDVIFTLPPYNRKRNDKYKLYDDKIEDYFGFLCDLINESMRVTKNFVALNIQLNHYNRQEVFKLMGHFYKNITEMIVWEKSNPMPASGFSITNAYEIVLIFSDKRIKANSTYTKNHKTISVFSNMPKNHKAVMNPLFASWFLKEFVPNDATVYDPFLGVGTTGVECNRLKINWFGSELIEEYALCAKNNTGANLK